MTTNSVNYVCDASIAEKFTRFFEGERGKDFAVNGALISCFAAGFLSTAGVLGGAEFLGDVFACIALMCVVGFVVMEFSTSKNKAQDTETLDEFLEEHSYAKALLEE